MPYSSVIQTLPPSSKRDCLAVVIRSPACYLVFVSRLEAITGASILAVLRILQSSNAICDNDLIGGALGQC